MSQEPADDSGRNASRLWSACIIPLAFLLAACGRQDDPQDWDTPATEPAAAGCAVESAPVEAADAQAPQTTPAESTSTHSGFRFIAYNVENWLTMDRYVDRELQRGKPKPENEKAAVVRLLTAHQPDVIGLCEVGTAADLEEIRERLKAAGLDLPHSHYTGGTDTVRHLGLLSRFPITSTARPAETGFVINGRTFGLYRGILDATITAHGKPYRFLGVHFKSKRPIPDFDQEEIRVHEARLLRRHVDTILEQDPQARLIVYGDFNDTRPTRTVRTITGGYNSPDYLTALPARDSRGHAWTHHWKPHDIYSRIDFITVSRALRTELDFRNSYIIDDPDWEEASDHRALLGIFR